LPVTERNLSFLFAASLRAWKCYPAIISPNANKAQCCQIPTSLNGWFCQKPQKESPLRRDPPPPHHPRSNMQSKINHTDDTVRM
jgi:hypothetical protein